MKKLIFKTVWPIMAYLIFAVLPGAMQQAQAQSPEENFKTLCQSCHRLDWKATVGPGLAGLKERRSDEWIRKWISNSSTLISSGDADAKKVFDQYNQIAMPPFPQLDDAQLTALIGYIDAEGTKAGPPPAVSSATAPTSAPNVADPLAVMLREVTTWAVVVLIILALVAWWLQGRTQELREANGQFDLPHQPQWLGLRFLWLLAAAGGITYLLVSAWKLGSPAANTIAFGVFPYVALASFVFGSWFRYRNRAFTVSSLSSQFLEGKQLFWGSQPFHWGILFLFFGHLIAFLFPRAVMAWNGMPLRLLILEVSSFVFGLSALAGVALLIWRRFGSGRLMFVASKADMLVYVTLLAQIISGLGVAFFVRWGSNWFAAVLTPYLRSVFTLSPEIDAVSALPWVVKLHIVSAFFIIAIIPFTRFMHFLVAPVAYLWRSYQVVIWNYNHRAVRSSTRHTFGRKSRNH